MSIDAFSQAFGGTDWNQMTAAAQKKAAALPPPPPPPAQTAANANAKNDGILTFGDILDTINPLQHIPLVDVVYRHLTGDTIRPQGQILGGLLYGGLIGGAIATASVLLHETTGVDAEETIYASLFGDSPASQSGTATAQAAPARTQTAEAQTTHTPAGASPGPAASAPPIQLHPAPQTATAARPPAAQSAQAQSAQAQPAQTRSASTQLAAALASDPADHATAETHARQAVTAANASALRQLAADLASGAQVGNAAAAPAAASPDRAGRMPIRGAVNPNPQMPAGYYNAGNRFGNLARSAPQTPGNTTLPTRPAPPVGPGTWRRLAPGGQDNATAQAQAQAPSQAQPAASDQAKAAAATQQLPPIPPPEAISQLMMRNLEKYQAMSRSAERPASQTNYIN